MSREYASGKRSGIPARLWASMSRAPAAVQAAINFARQERGLELLPFETASERLTAARSRGAAAIERLRAFTAGGRW